MADTDKQELGMLGSQRMHWNQVARRWFRISYANELLAEHKRQTYLRLISSWVDVTDNQRILKTDLFAEAFGPEQFLFYIAQANGNIVGIDIANEIVIRAKEQARHHGIDSSKYLCCDIKQLPLQNDSIDLIISDSTLDHFPSEDEIVTAIKELGRVLRVGGTLILTIDNKGSITYPPYIFFRLWMWLGLSPYFIGKTLSRAKLKHTLENIGLIVEESTAIFHYPHPDGLVRLIEICLRKISRGKLDSVIKKGLVFLNRLEKKRTRYLTGRYIAVKAVKRGTP